MMQWKEQLNIGIREHKTNILKEVNDMRRTKNVELIEFDELSDEVQKGIINDTIQLIIDTTNFEKLNKNTKLYKAYKACEKMKTPWFLGQYIWEYCKKMVLKACRRRLYSEDGSIAEAK